MTDSGGPVVRRAPLEAWTGREKLWLAMAVARAGDQSWVSVARALRPLGHESKRPPEYFSQQSCAAQYGALLDEWRRAQTPRRKKRPTEPLEAPQEAILARLVDERARELARLMAERAAEHARLEAEIAEVEAPDTSRERLLELDAETRRPTAEPPRPSPLLTSLLQSSADEYREQLRIEQIKSELQKIEQNLAIPPEPPQPRRRPEPPPPPPPEAPKTPEKIDIDDIEIKAEDVYAFSDVDLDIQPVSSIHKSAVGRPARADRSEDGVVEAAPNEAPKLEELVEAPPEPERVAAEPERKPADDDAETAPTPETIVEHVKTEPKDEAKPDYDAAETNKVDAERSDGADEIRPSAEDGEATAKVESDKTENTEEKQTAEPTESNVETDDDTPIEVIKEDKPGKTKRDYSRKRADKDERSSPSRDSEGIVSIKVEFSDEIASDNSQESADKKILSRRFRQEFGGSRSESPATPTDSLPNSPAPATPPCNPSVGAPALTPDLQDKDYRIWKKSVLQALNRLYTLRFSSLFMKPITDDQAPGYSKVVKKPMDLSTIRRNIDSGVLKTTQMFQRDVMLMLTNALMYNRTDHRVHAMALETIQDAVSQINDLLQAQAHAASETISLSRLTRPPRPASRSAGLPIKRKRGSLANDTPLSKKRRNED